MVDVKDQPVLAAWDTKLGGVIADLVQTVSSTSLRGLTDLVFQSNIHHSWYPVYVDLLQKDFKGKPGSAARVRLGGVAVKSLTLVGLGKKSTLKSARAVGRSKRSLLNIMDRI